MDTRSSVEPAEFSPAVLIDKSQDGSLGHLEFFFPGCWLALLNPQI